MRALMAAELLKIKRKMVWFLIFLGPLGVIGLQAVNFRLRYDYLTEQYAKDLWGGLILNVGYLTVPTLLIGLTLITSMISNVEHQTNAWKQLLALPVRKAAVFTAKFVFSAALLFISSTLLGIGTAVLGVCLGFEMSQIPVKELLIMSYFPFFAAMPFVALQIWLAVIERNQAIPLSVGILGMVVCTYGVKLPDWMPWKWPSLINGWGGPEYSALAGLLTGLAVYLAGSIHFTRKDVK
ncbi:ABC transporter permease [Bacillus sp. T33-2]|uniref:ABC transporter permease n=1 Tax=Bacillus sp. T33-2 TaxID=2054168 RepID=UPI00268F754E|nr:ABC transporter permease [Bacillus sp. T33-2]